MSPCSQLRKKKLIDGERDIYFLEQSLRLFKLFKVYAWMVPDNEEVAKEEADHLFVGADDDHDDFLRLGKNDVTFIFTFTK